MNKLLTFTYVEQPYRPLAAYKALCKSAFALLPEDEARIVARRLVADGKLTGVALVPDGEWGNRVSAAFADELTHLGGAVVDTGRYESGRADFSDVIKQTLQIHGVKGEPATHRSDAAFVFAAGTSGRATLTVAR